SWHFTFVVDRSPGFGHITAFTGNSDLRGCPISGSSAYHLEPPSACATGSAGRTSCTSRATSSSLLDPEHIADDAELYAGDLQAAAEPAAPPMRADQLARIDRTRPTSPGALL